MQDKASSWTLLSSKHLYTSFYTVAKTFKNNGTTHHISIISYQMPVIKNALCKQNIQQGSIGP